MPKFAPVDWKTLECIFIAAGFQFARQEGSHRSYLKAGVARPVVILTYREVPVFIIRNNLKTRAFPATTIFARWHNVADGIMVKRTGKLLLYAGRRLVEIKP